MFVVDVYMFVYMFVYMLYFPSMSLYLYTCTYAVLLFCIRTIYIVFLFFCCCIVVCTVLYCNVNVCNERLQVLLSAGGRKIPLVINDCRFLCLQEEFPLVSIIVCNKNCSDFFVLQEESIPQCNKLVIS